ncbi:MAG: helix-hairpin-helix domain-containing protein [Anaerolineae bacterium]
MPTLEGAIERITFHNEENGYTVARLIPDGKDYEVTVIGNMLGVQVGEHVRLEGEWTVHGQYGRQFKVERYASVLPATAAGIEKYLGSGLVKGVGPVTAKRIVRKFGADTLTVIDETPERLREVLGVGPKRVGQIKTAWHEQRQIREVMVFLQSHGVSPALAVRIYKHYGDGAAGVVRNDPYRLARDIHGIGFITADKIARNLGIAPDAPERVAAGVAYTLGQEGRRGARLRAAGGAGAGQRQAAGGSRAAGGRGHRQPASGRAGARRAAGRQHRPGRGARGLPDPLLLRGDRRGRPAAPADGRGGGSLLPSFAASTGRRGWPWCSATPGCA